VRRLTGLDQMCSRGGGAVFQGLVAPTLLPLSLPHRAIGMNAARPKVGDGGSGGVVLVSSCAEVEVEGEG
jgi:hypothetical protein